MYELKKENGKVFTSKFVQAGPSSYKKRIYRAAVSQSLRNTDLGKGVLKPVFNGMAQLVSIYWKNEVKYSWGKTVLTGNKASAHTKARIHSSSKNNNNNNRKSKCLCTNLEK